MTLKLNLNGSADPFINYLKSYLRIRESLLLEIDTNLRAFVAKTFTEDKSSIRFSSITFDEAHVSIVSDDGESERGDNRIKVGILIQLKKFIQIVERLGSDVNEKGESNFNIEIDYEMLQNQKDKSIDFITTSIAFSSDILKMRMDGFMYIQPCLCRFLSARSQSSMVGSVTMPRMASNGITLPS